MTNFIPITTPTIKVNKCNKGTYYHEKQNYCTVHFRILPGVYYFVLPDNVPY